ncbi:MAG: hypothetical protein ABL888_20395 [Pirellulaceae bacterium]|jgi:hypothetical protein
MLHYIDFVPQQIRGPGFLDHGEYEDFDAAVAAANAWLLNHKVKLLNLETIVLPNIWSRFEEGTRDSALHTSGEMTSTWHQFLRCWYMDVE